MNRSAILVAALSVLAVTPLVGRGQTKGTAEKLFTETKAKAEAGDVNAQYKLAAMYASKKKDPKNQIEAVKWYRRVAAQGDARGQSMLGVMYTNSRGVKRDYDQAILWFRKAAAQGSAHAKYNLGYMYAVGKGVGRDQVQSSDWYRQAALLGDAGSQRILGSRYAAGQGVDKDLVQAYAWTEVVLPRGGPAASKQLAAIEAQMTPDQIVAAKKAAKEISARLAKLGEK